MGAVTIISASLVFADDDWKADHAIAILGDVIVAVGDIGSVQAAYPDAAVEHWNDSAIVPGGVNGHGHTFQALLRGFGDDLKFGDWMGGLVHPTAAGLGTSALDIGARYDFVEMLRMGITTAVEFFYLHDEGNDNSRVILEAGKAVGLRTVLARCMFDANPGPTRYQESLETYEKNFRELSLEVENEPLLEVHPAPHSVLGTSAEMLKLGSALAHEFSVPLHVHVADSQGEVDVSNQRFGHSPVARLHDVGVLDDHLLAVHTVRVDEPDLKLLAESGATVVHNPSTNAFLGGGIAPLVRMRELGIPVCLGTDAGGANSRQSLFEEMRMAALLAKATSRDGSIITAVDALRLGTSAGGAALRMPVGRIATGYKADLVSLDLEALSLRPRRTATQNIIYSMLPEAVARVMVGGRLVMQGGDVLTVDAAAIGADVDRLTAGWTPLTGSHPIPVSR
ncbi:5-methylthioadenosine/S-adenosylhomocysteine deaminase [Glaciihabitans tibetensis]|uniref:5-methylthioadenosine/S-adenosylhomocysteine deaminase n=1 Tax=Glaciihabitans tibetensis TaxID=1266600 RepID=A0A2T0VJX7_9MICO|nr:amidohydrolase family protein [Glaciihabitans tibetensis]PRY70512.1 5-methylthioadenosine/S-adenosylhomocysteine deaminase [Glaciihabitans tibetensis]